MSAKRPEADLNGHSMRTTGIVIMVFAIAASAFSYLVGARHLYLLRGRRVRLTFARPESAIDDNYAVVSMPILAPLTVLFVLGLVLFVIA